MKGEEKIEDVCMRANEHLSGLETGFTSIFRASRKLRMCVVYVYVRKRTFDWLVALGRSRLSDGFCRSDDVE